MKCIFRDSDGRCCKTVCQFHLRLVSEKTCNECDEMQDRVTKSDKAQVQELVKEALQHIEKPSAVISHLGNAVLFSENANDEIIRLLKEALEI